MTGLIASGLDRFTDARTVLRGQDLTGRTAIVTGGATGIGVETARALAEAGAEVVIAVRKPDLGVAAAEDVNRTAKGPGARVQHLNLADLASVRAFAADWGSKPLHLLINNAGVMATPFSHTADGLEMQIGTNHFGHFLLGTLLAPSLERGAESGRASRVVSLSSIGHRRSDIIYEDIDFERRPYEKWSAYGQSKTANALFAVGFHQRFEDRGITANSVMPGGIMTPLQRHLPREEQIAMGWMNEAGVVAQGFKTPAQGASTSVWAAVGPELEGVGGLYLEDLAQAPPATRENRLGGVEAYALDPENAERLWAVSETTVGA